MSALEGVVIGKSSRDVRVDAEGGVLRCSFRGRFRDRGEGRSTAVVGDRVLVSKLAAGEGILEKVLPRRSELVRGTASGASVVVAANVDRLLVILAAREPPPRWALVDRMLVAAERDGLESAVCLNKLDQAGPEVERAALEEILALYRNLGYGAFFVSALSGGGLEGLRSWLRDKTTVLSGHSGVGKSTLINALSPSLDLVVGDLNRVTGKGRQTTTAVSLFKLPSGGYVADTPGFREFQPVDLKPADLGRHYPEFRRVLEGARCRFSDCLHRIEPSCAVRKAVDVGAVSKMRYENYLQILASLLDPTG